MFCDIHTHNTNPRIPSVIDISGGVDFPFVGGCLYSAGIHPREIPDSCIEDRLHIIGAMAADGRIQAIGECGVDKFSGTDIEEQFSIFLSQADIARKYGLPLIVHCVRLYQYVIKLIKELRLDLPVILHGFGANVETARQLLKYPNVYFSIGKMLNRKVLESLHEIPMERILTESDTDTEMNFNFLIEEIASVKNVPRAVVEAKVFDNYRKILNL